MAGCHGYHRQRAPWELAWQTICLQRNVQHEGGPDPQNCQECQEEQQQRRTTGQVTKQTRENHCKPTVLSQGKRSACLEGWAVWGRILKKSGDNPIRIEKSHNEAWSTPCRVPESRTWWHILKLWDCSHSAHARALPICFKAMTPAEGPEKKHKYHLPQKTLTLLWSEYEKEKK